MVQVIKTIEIKDLSAEEAGFAFANWCSDEQAQFFNAVTVAVAKWPSLAAIQWNAIAVEGDLTDAGRTVMRHLGEAA